MNCSQELQCAMLLVGTTTLIPRKVRRQLAGQLASGELSAEEFFRILDGLPREEHARVQRLVQYLEENRFSYISFISPDYPRPLRSIADPPIGIFVYGNARSLSRLALDVASSASSNQNQCVAIVGTRNPTPYGRRTAFQLAETVAAAGIVVVSGFALGVDSAAHRGAISAVKARKDSPLGTIDAGIAVLGSGFCHLYPPQNRDLVLEFLAAGGVLVSEYAPDVEPERYQFPERNRIVSGLAQAVVVVEAAEQSGALVTAGIAAEQGRTVFALPGPIDVPQSVGALSLIREGAQLLDCADTLLSFLGARARHTDSGLAISEALRPELQALYDLVRSERLAGIELLREKLQLPTGDLLGHLSELELEGWITREEGGSFAVLR